jgi:hypothetical protein
MHYANGNQQRSSIATSGPPPVLVGDHGKSFFHAGTSARQLAAAYCRNSVADRKCEDAAAGADAAERRCRNEVPDEIRTGGCQAGVNSAIQGFETAAKVLSFRVGWVAEWLKAPVLKTGEPARVPWVRIPPHPPQWVFANVRQHTTRAARAATDG